MLQHSTWYIGTAVVAKVAFRPGSFSGVDGFARKLRGVDNAYVIPHLPRRDHAVVAMRHVRPSPAQATPILACPRSRCWLLRFFFFFLVSTVTLLQYRPISQTDRNSFSETAIFCPPRQPHG